MAISDIPDRYTIIHWAFADITADFQISISPYEDDWADFIRSTGFKKIVSFGGWAFSTEVCGTISLVDFQVANLPVRHLSHSPSCSTPREPAEICRQCCKIH